MILTTTAGEVVDFAANHLSLIAWPALLGIVWRFRGSFDKYFSDQKLSAEKIANTFTAVEDAKKIAAESVKTAVEEGAKRAQELQVRLEKAQVKIEATAAAVQKIDQNDLAHLAEGLNKKWVEQTETSRDTLAVLNNIDKNIAVLAERALVGANSRRK
jgi:hypothetical protein